MSRSTTATTNDRPLRVVGAVAPGLVRVEVRWRGRVVTELFSKFLRKGITVRGKARPCALCGYEGATWKAPGHMSARGIGYICQGCVDEAVVREGVSR